MFVIYNENTRVPIRIWLDSIEDTDEGTIEDAYHLSNLPFLHKWVALMPDTHKGMGMPIGGVIAAKNVIIPNAVGVDIGCGMSFVSTNIPVAEIKNIETGSGTFIQSLVGDILRNIPVGFNHHKRAQLCQTLDIAKQEQEKYLTNKELWAQIDNGYYQVGTLGGGNHFIELQEDDDGNLGIMLHSGSRHFGKKICDIYNSKAKELNEKWFSSVPSSYHLAFLPTDTTEGKEYINWMQLAMDFAYENRRQMLKSVKESLNKHIKKYTDFDFDYGDEINCHHNYADLEHHYGKDVWVHRKGAIRARTGDIGIIPGAMGSYSYITQGLGNEESFTSCSHGAGRKFSRTTAMKNFSLEEVILDLKDKNVVLGKHNKTDVAEESRFAYKDIDAVMAHQIDLVKPLRRLKTIGVVKG